MTLSQGEKAADFELWALESNKVWRLGDVLSRGPVLLVFVKESCPTCQFALPLVDRIFGNYPDSRVSIVTIAQDEPEVAYQMVHDLRLKLPVLLDRDPYPVSESYGFGFVPAFFYVGHEGKLEHVIEGFAREELKQMNEKIARANGLGSPISFIEPGEDVPFFRPG